MTDSTQINSIATELYGAPSAAVTVRLSNGGAGPSGVLRALAEDYLTHTASSSASPSASPSAIPSINIAWIRNISRLGLRALSAGFADIALTYERDQERDFIAQEEGAQDFGCIFNDHFVLVGPQSSLGMGVPQGTGSDAAVKAFEALARDASAKIISRNDGSATHLKEIELWQMAGVTQDHALFTEERYVRRHVFPHEALRLANDLGAFTIVDWATWLTFAASRPNLEIYVRGGAILLNPCHAIAIAHKVSPSVQAFLDYLVGPRAQDVVLRRFGEDMFNVPLFTPAGLEDFDM